MIEVDYFSYARCELITNSFDGKRSRIFPPYKIYYYPLDPSTHFACSG